MIDALQLVEDDYLGGSGSRGSGKVDFASIVVTSRSSKDYGRLHTFETGAGGEFDSVQSLADAFDALLEWAEEKIPLE